MSKLLKFNKYIRGKSVAVVGLGISNIPLIEFLLKNKAMVTAYDKCEEIRYSDVYESLKKMGVKFKLGDGYLSDLSQDIIFKTPGMRFDTPQLLHAVNNGSKVTSETEVFFELCPAKIIGITGSDGKTTTSTLIYNMLKKQGYRVWLGGNIGTPLLNRVEEMSEDDFAVLELSSFQLHTMHKSPQTAVITNITPNHLDFHKDFEEYISAKENIMKYQNPSDKLIVNYDNEITREIGKKAKGECRYFSCQAGENVFYKDNCIRLGSKTLLSDKLIKVKGNYNIQNFMAAIAAVYEYVEPANISEAASEFKGVPHRTEFVKSINGIEFYNSSVDSSPNRTVNTLSVFDKRVILICGGKSKGLSFEKFGEYIADKVKTVVLIGETAAEIEVSVKNVLKNKNSAITIMHADTLTDAVKRAYMSAKTGDCIVLSPASTSFDMFKNFEQRGNLFKKAVNELE